jgi:type II secretory ATPase GspE/PulE/Tfp pilus assembly ATPase PilB-like protein
VSCAQRGAAKPSGADPVNPYEPGTAVLPPILQAVFKPSGMQRFDALLARVQASPPGAELSSILSDEICAVFGADRFRIFAMSEDNNSIVGKIQIGATGFKELKLPLSEASVAGFTAMRKAPLNIADVYDEAELQRHHPRLKFLTEIDKRTGYLTKQMLTMPLLAEDGALLGVFQLINSRDGKPFSDVALKSASELAKKLALKMPGGQSSGAVKNKYDALVFDKVLSAEDLEAALRTARTKNKDVETILSEDFSVKPASIGAALSKFFQVPYEPFRPERVKPLELLRKIKREYAETTQWVPVDDTPLGIVIVAIDPERLQASHVAKQIFPNQKLIYRVTTLREFALTLDQFFSADSSGGASIDEMISGLGDEGEDSEINPEDVSLASENELVKLVNRIIIDAYRQGASDIHVEPYPGKQKTQIRFRKDGTLSHYIDVPANYRNALITRLKIMCDLDISEKRKPQDGKIKFKKFGPLDIELRVATIPSAGGVEDVVMRILAAGEPIPMDKLGLSTRNLENLKKTIAKPYGLFFVCGPTGSGKTTTLHSVLGSINTPGTKIWTAEDPVEITQKGLRQVQMNPKAGLTFAIAMRAFLRADPDVIMVGEMRDKETVSIGIEASLTGHLVFATLHTNSATESIVRLLDMGMDPFNFADALLGVLAQRLAKRLCSKCKTSHVATRDEMKRLVIEYSEELTHSPEWKKDPQAGLRLIYEDWVRQFANDKGEFTLFTPVGCDVCSGTGYKGRLGLHELLLGTDTVKKNIQEHARVAEILATALSEGMRTLKQDGIEKVLQGITDMFQVRAVCIK